MLTKLELVAELRSAKGEQLDRLAWLVPGDYFREPKRESDMRFRFRLIKALS
jgi:hypothetical protein